MSETTWQQDAAKVLGALTRHETNLRYHNELVRQMIDDNPAIGARESHNIRRALDAGEAYGYGNIIAWLATAWAVKLRDESGLSEADAIEAVSHRTPYALPPNDKLTDAGTKRYE
jgi:hypothetical protein